MPALPIDPEFEFSPDPSPEPVLPITSNTSDITPVQRMISACSGSILTSLTMTPLDVVRIRLQQQEILAPSSECCKRQVFWNEVQPAVSSITNGNTLVPGECRTTHSTVCSITEGKMQGTFRSMVEITRKEGITTLWRGLSLTLLMAGPSNVVYFTGYEFLRDTSPFKDYSSLNSLISGGMARILAATVVSPIELVKTRLQSIPSSQQDIFKSLMNKVYSEFQAKGPGILFKGLSLTLWRDVPFSAIYWASYEYFKSHFQNNFNLQNLDENTNLFLHSFLSGSLAGSIAAVATNPFDVGKTRMQISTQSTSPTGIALSNAKEKSMTTFMTNIIKFEGFGALYVGLFPRLLKIAPSCAIMISSYEIGKSFFSKSNESCI